MGAWYNVRNRISGGGPRYTAAAGALASVSAVLAGGLALCGDMLSPRVWVARHATDKAVHVAQLLLPVKR